MITETVLIFRITPTYAFVIFFSATYITELGNGPLWKLSTEYEQSFCQQYWWTNLLYVNNYIYADTPCFQHAWFFAVDFQFTILSAIFLAIIYKYPRHVEHILGGAFVFWIFMFSYIFHVKKLEIGLSVMPEFQKHIRVNEIMYSDLHIKSHMLLDSMILGLVSALIYHRLKIAKINPNNSKLFSFIYISCIPVIIGMIASNTYYNYNHIDKPSILLTMHNTVFKLILSFYIGTFFVGFKFNIEESTQEKKNRWFSILTIPRLVQKTLSHSSFLILGRLSYCAVLVHPIVMRIMKGQNRSPNYISFTNIYVCFIAATVITYQVSVMLYLLIEMPSTTLTNVLILRMQSRSKSTKHVKNN